MSESSYQIDKGIFMKLFAILSSILLIFSIFKGCSYNINKVELFNGSHLNDEQINNQDRLTSKDNEDGLALEERFFNNVKEQNGRLVIQNPDNILALVNKDQGLPETYKPSDLIIPNVQFSFGKEDIPKSYLRKEAAMALEQMFLAAGKEQIELFAVSGYRSYNKQQAIYNLEIQKWGEEKAVQAVALPGHSEHQTGLAMDITSRSVQFKLTEEFGQTWEGKWVAENAHKFGFIIRYPKGKEHITGYQYEPWHIRYVGKKAAKVIFEKGLTLEEYFELVKKV
jgi:D-alanyl-D-alanine carboxypeptidase